MIYVVFLTVYSSQRADRRVPVNLQSAAATLTQETHAERRERNETDGNQSPRKHRQEAVQTGSRTDSSYSLLLLEE